MLTRRLKAGCFVLEGLNSFATVYYLYYIYFFMQQRFGFGNRANLCLGALNGAVYALLAWQAGKFAQRFGCFTALKLGFGTMLAALLAGSQIHSAAGHVVVLAVTVAGMCFTWPTLEAMVSEGETRSGLQRMVGLYNVVWAGTAAIGYFTGGAMLEKWGSQSLFYVPAAILAVQLGLTLIIEAQARRTTAVPAHSIPSEPPAPHPPGRGKVFLRLAWMANPFAYIAMQTIVVLIPGVAERLGLSTMLAGFCCSVWCFARLGAFLLLWLWDGWHYRFGWLFTSFVALVAAFVAILLAPNMAILVVAQLVFGGGVGLLYYSSLFYSMDLSDTKGEHGGIHESALGLGNFAGPAVGAASLYAFPNYANSGALAVSGLLLLGLGGLLVIWHNRH